VRRLLTAALIVARSMDWPRSARPAQLGDTRAARGRSFGMVFRVLEGDAKFGRGARQDAAWPGTRLDRRRARMQSAPVIPDELWLRIARATFVTAEEGRDLRGASGSLEAHRLWARMSSPTPARRRFRIRALRRSRARRWRRGYRRWSLFPRPGACCSKITPTLIRPDAPGRGRIILDARAGARPSCRRCGKPARSGAVLAQPETKGGDPRNVRTARCKCCAMGHSKWSEAAIRGGTLNAPERLAGPYSADGALTGRWKAAVRSVPRDCACTRVSAACASCACAGKANCETLCCSRHTGAPRILRRPD